ncbi:drug resistance transporter, Bcr/CflA subfamily [Desulfobulbus propionicus DSM 2032]|uniref:Drug resistance transporter, Bcr/CflA subfamily n=1 Tax=Desulfobulbus propionicus (strain ATCC 33891 / DSM 2032 / VKM B-1956 / 1pr3) TaxID=577650 RepID=A0A7U3YK60_DESPD|nr:multidrug effflux MFS transporter [Desulfobulbus propionicus]ADW16881.1 drug resistance transporter, Bcr/CflA subfamily [Desulfobulbus propionicus DSM 2032]
MGMVHEIRERFPPIIFLLALLSAFPPLATDMYLPALPLLQHELQAQASTINLTLVAFFMAYCGCLLIYGPLSDRYGRKPPLLVGVTMFILACLVCAFSSSAPVMIFGRFLQGAGAAAASAIVFAISKDRFSGQQRQRVFIHIGVIVATAPMVAPIAGGWIIKLLTWRWIFILQTLLGAIAFAGVLAMRESLRPRTPPSLREVAFSYLRLMGNRRYFSLLLTVSLTCVPVFAFIGGSSEIYITRFGYNEQQFGYFFGFNALAFVLAPLAFARVNRRYSITRLMPWAFGGMLLASLLLLNPWLPIPWRLTLPMFALTFCFSFCRPAGNNLILEQVDRDTGAASSLMVFFYFFIGALAMWFLSFAWEDKVVVLGWMGVGSVTSTLLLWQAVKRRIRTLP